jgi:LysM repeat protein
MARPVGAVWLFVVIAAAAAAHAQEIRKVQSSGEQWSGEGKQYSGWYVLRSDPPPPGYYLADSAFTLTGDRTCGSWAECREIARSPYGVTWEFRMQGHDESSQLTSFFIAISQQPKLNDPKTWPRVQVTLSGKKATSTGVLELVYRPDPPPNLPATITWTRRREEWSGHGGDYSQWYDISSEPTPPRYSLTGVDFHLEGDRQCGSWAECHETRRDASGVTWAFRMQGHSEQTEFVDGAIRGKAAASTGVLTTTYTLTNPPPPAPVAPTLPTTYTVVKGDCLARIAQRYYGRQIWPVLYRANRKIVRNPHRIFPGQQLTIPAIRN